MRLHPCPVCGKEPTIIEWGDMLMAFCWCGHKVRAGDRDALRHRWNDLYCANDPATVEDCE